MYSSCSKYVKNVYTDVVEYFSRVKTELCVKGSYAYEMRKGQICQLVDGIIMYANDLSVNALIPMKAYRPAEWGFTLSEVECNRLIDIRNYTNQCISQYWDRLNGVDENLKRMLMQLDQLFVSLIPELSLYSYFNLFLSKYGNELNTTEKRNLILSYLLIYELKVELDSTIFFKAFPSLKIISSGNSLDVIARMIHNQTVFIQQLPGYRQLNDQLHFGSFKLLNTDIAQSNSMYVLSAYFDEVVCILNQIKSISNEQISYMISQLVSELYNLQYKCNESPMRETVKSISDFYSYAGYLKEMRKIDKEYARSLLKYMGDVYKFFKDAKVYGDLVEDMGAKLTYLLSMYEQLYK